jgi:hypothetical protein
MKTKFSLCISVIALIALGVLPQSNYGQEKAKSKDGGVRDWNLADGSKETGELESVEVMIRLPNGELKSVPFNNIPRADRKLVMHWLLTAKDAKPIASGNAKPAAKPIARQPASQKFTAFGDLKLTPTEIQQFLDECKKDKSLRLAAVRNHFNALATRKGISAEEIKALKDAYQLVSRDDVLIVPHSTSSVIFKLERGYIAEPSGAIEVLKIVDRRTAYTKLGFVEGVDTSKIPLGRWNSQYMFKKTGTRKVPAQIGEDEVDVYQAVSSEGFPKDVILW